MKPVMQDLNDAIFDVLTHCFPIEGNGVAHLGGYWAVDESSLKVLQAEYNIHFVEPEDEQVNII